MEIISKSYLSLLIPQIAENLTKSGTLEIPDTCPTCGGATRIQKVNEVETLYCTNPDCQAKKIKSFTLFVSRDAINIDGLSEMTLEKFISCGFIKEYADIFHLEQHREEIINMEGFGEKSFQKLMESVEKARKTTLPRLLYSLGIPNVGLANAKVLCKEYHYDFQRLRQANAEELSQIAGIGGVIGNSIEAYFSDKEHNRCLDELLQELEIQVEEASLEKQNLDGLIFVITGSLEQFANRNELKNLIESKGGKVTGSVTSKTSYLINNDTLSNSSKNKKAKELGVEIISEKEFLEQFSDEK